MSDGSIDGPAPRSHPTYPVNIVLSGQRCLVVGGGRVAARKATGLLEAGARVAVVAPDAVPLLRDDDRVRWYARPYQRGEVAAYRLGIAATGRPDVDGQVYRDAEAAGVLVNSADDPEHCRFTLPAIARRGDIQLTASTNGRSPALATWLRRRLEELLDDDLMTLLDLLAGARAELHRDGRSSDIEGWQEALDAGILDLVRRGDVTEARRRLERHLSLAAGAPA
jgi:precorrin-2 dehydrogenase/sirohydrochlorin ferrochelatase